MAPTPTPAPSSDDPCGLLQGPAAAYCGGNEKNIPRAPDPEVSTDPLTSLAHSVANGAAWVAEQLGKAVDGVANVDFTNATFLQQYAVVFAASTVLTIMLWVIAVTKRAIRGVSLTRAAGEAVGLLWLTVAASAFTPLILYVVTAAVDGVTAAVAGSSSGSAQRLFADLAAALRGGADQIGGGPLMLLVVALATILAAGLLWLILVLRAVTLYVGAILGTVVYAGMVDRSLWAKVRRWAGFMLAVVLVKPVIVAAVGIAGVFTADSGPGSTPVVVAGLAVMLLALAASAAVFKFTPGYGDEIVSGLALRAARGGVRTGMAGVKAASSAAGVVSQGMQAHADRSPRAESSGGKKGGSRGVSDGMQAHGSRSVEPKRPKGQTDNRKGSE
ncbi:hypothetical protein [Streptomyces sp. NPDC045369]|uniref:hypothetical protein n=1 Tax=Streptomyces sp. NPDC045369 TaxID=3155732 RepID=UPI0033CE57AB